jgi:hypothetical protein
VRASVASLEAVEQAWNEHVGKRRMDELRRTLSALREIADPYR